MSMANDNNGFDHTFHRYRQQSQELTVSGDFEDKVFSKIKRKKTQRKITAGVTLGLAIAAVVFIAQVVSVHREPAPTFAAQTERGIKEEVPVMEDVVYASSDSKTNYAIEQVAYYDDQNSI